MHSLNPTLPSTKPDFFVGTTPLSPTEIQNMRRILREFELANLDVAANNPLIPGFIREQRRAEYEILKQSLTEQQQEVDKGAK